jgi:hypothetical protein
MIDFGAFTFPWETREATNRAIQDWSKQMTGAAPTAPVPATAAPPAVAVVLLHENIAKSRSRGGDDGQI